jgi:CheY-like chemotaxis protein
MRQTILVVDDDDGVRRVISEMLRHEGYAVDQAASGRTALEMLGGRQPDLILVDMVLPDIPGLQMISMLRERPARPRILAVSGLPHLLEVAAAAGADGAVAKPMTPEELIEAVRRALDGTAQGRSAGF